MSRRRELQARIAGLSEISAILGAMKGLALVELRRVGELIDAQRESVQEIGTALADVLQFHRAALRLPEPPYVEVCCVVGAERGFCGDFNARISQAAVAHLADAAAEHIILVGDKLADGWPAAAQATTRVRAPSVADEVPAVLTGLLAAINALAAGHADRSLRLVVLHHGADGIQSRQLLPLPEPPPLPSIPVFPPRLYLQPADCLAALTDHYLYALLHALLYESLLEENRRRLEHMDLARHRLDEQLVALQRRENQERQEEIIEEIEVILLTAS
ncbi:MAG: F0F1 ATP synthase subunit gamma [Sinimarinibacterium sp.]|jgi:F-type H+-transporting ATPase subunit gamma